MKRIVIFSISVLVVVIGYFSYRSFTQSQREHFIFCQTLHKDMTVDEVINSLKDFGAISPSKTAVEESGYDEIAVGYVDSKIVGRNGYILSFQDGKYTGVSVIVFLDDVDSVCN